MFESLEEFPDLWFNTIHCQVHHDYSRCEDTRIYHTMSDRVEESEWEGVKSLVAGDLLMTKPYRMYEKGEELLLQLKQGGNYFLLSSPYIRSGCDSCDEETESNFTVKEFANIYDLVYEFLDTDIGFYMFLDQRQKLQTFEQLLQFSETELEERFFGS
ncbi:hypothetical protein BQ9231_00153 [Cedratvirus lausannensis]|uniref:DUF5869 domain-containing protein n=1 Tax=Cedratvirus lausannensis TaxID=2023205 RepID=A0A285PXZ9_9VIRU|nr:hypothetical protein BQ9231_00153 [Cedratvirus lausannensis]